MNKIIPVTYSTISVHALANELLIEYELGKEIDIKFAHRGLNDTYTVQVENGTKYVLRVYRNAWRTLSDISYEIDVLNHLGNKGVPVSRPLPDKNGRFIQTVFAPEGDRYVVLFTYADGKDLSYENDEEKISLQYGKIAARIHEASKDFTTKHERFRLDIEYLIDEPLKSIGPVIAGREEDWLYLQSLVERIRNHIRTLPLETLEQGFCHGDFHGGNAHISEDGNMTLFDFDCCGWGWRSYDLAVFRWGARLRKKEDERWLPFLRGYNEVRELSDIDLQAVSLFVGIRHIWLLGLHTGNGTDWGFGWINDRYFDKEIQFLRSWDAEFFRT